VLCRLGAGSAGAVTVEAVSGCFATLVLTSLPLSLVMMAMLRYTAALRPSSVILMGSLAVCDHRDGVVDVPSA
jgi:hypothetical protein